VSGPHDLSRERAILFTVGFGGMLVPLNSTMIAVAIPNIGEQLHASVSQTGWLVTAYLITMAALPPITGKLGDRYGRRPFLLGGYALFAIASVGAALASSIWTLIIFRGGQALAGAVIFPNGTALLREIVPAERRGARFGLLGSSIAFGAAVGPPLGGLLVEFGDWPAIFWANLPIVAAVLLVAWRTIPGGRPVRTQQRFDLAGAALLAGVLALGAWVLTRLRDVTPVAAVATAAVIAGGFVLFLWRELRHPDPVVQPRFFRRRSFTSATGGIALSNVTMYSLLLAVPLLLDRRSGWTEARIGLVVTSMSAGMVLLAPIGGRLSDRLAGRRPSSGCASSRRACSPSRCSAPGSAPSTSWERSSSRASGSGWGPDRCRRRPWNPSRWSTRGWPRLRRRRRGTWAASSGRRCWPGWCRPATASRRCSR
jgi:EmrB/QacA subfamily drug resistance transporter